MRWRQRWIRLRRLLLHGSQDDRDLDNEIRFHLEQEAELRAERGTSIEQARREARRAFGSVAATKETTRAVWVGTSIEDCLRDIRLGWRILPTSPSLSAAAIILVALVVGANITLFSVAHGVLKKPAPGVTAHDVVRLNWITEDGFAEPRLKLRCLSRAVITKHDCATDDGVRAVRPYVVWA